MPGCELLEDLFPPSGEDDVCIATIYSPPELVPPTPCRAHCLPHSRPSKTKV